MQQQIGQQQIGQQVTLTTAEYAMYEAGMRQGMMAQIQKTYQDLSQIDSSKLDDYRSRLQQESSQMAAGVQQSLAQALSLRKRSNTLLLRIKRAVIAGVDNYRKGG